MVAKEAQKNLYKIEKYKGKKLGFTSFNTRYKCFNIDSTSLMLNSIPIIVEAETEAEFLLKLQFAGFDFNKVVYKKVSNSSVKELVKIKCVYNNKLFYCITDFQAITPFIDMIIERKYGKNYKENQLNEPIFIQSFRNDILDFILEN